MCIRDRWISAHANLGTALYIAFNPTADPIEYALPQGRWRMRVNTARPTPHDIADPENAPELLAPNLHVGARALVVLTGIST